MRSGAVKEDIQLKVSESLTKDMGRGIARIDPLDMQAIGVKVGDVILISGQKQAAARIMPAYEDRRGKRLIQIDGILRENLGAALGDKVIIQCPLCQDKDFQFLSEPDIPNWYMINTSTF